MKIEWLESLARRLRDLVGEHGLALSHGQSLDLIAAVPGLRNWPEVAASPDRVEACRFDEAAVERIAHRLTARHSLAIAPAPLLRQLRWMSQFYQGASASTAMTRLIVTTDDSGAGHLKQSRIADKVVALRDCLVWGPVPGAEDPAGFFRARETAHDGDPRIAGELHDWDRAQPALAAWEEVLALCKAYERVELWIDPTPNEQLLAVRTITWLAAHPAIVDKLYVVHADGPLGERSGPHLATLSPRVVKVQVDAIETASRAWNAWCARSPERWFGLLETDLDAFPYLRGTVMLLLGELPALGTALGATERLLLRTVAPGDVRPGRFSEANIQDNAGRVFGHFEEGRIIDRMASCAVPTLVGLLESPFDLALHDDRTRFDRYLQSRLSLSELGRALIDRRDDFSRHNRIDRWWGGSRLTNANLWRWDRLNATLLPPP
jgi:hypothetical protein